MLLEVLPNVLLEMLQEFTLKVLPEALHQEEGRGGNGQQALKTQEKVEAAKKFQLPGHQGPATELQEDPGGGGAPRSR